MARTPRAPRAPRTAPVAPVAPVTPVITSIKPDASGFALIASTLRSKCNDAVILHMVKQVETTCTPYTCAFTGVTITPDWTDGFAQLTKIADTAFNAGTLDANVLKSMYRLIGQGQEVTPRVTSEVSAIKRSSLRAGRNLAK